MSTSTIESNFSKDEISALHDKISDDRSEFISAYNIAVDDDNDTELLNVSVTDLVAGGLSQREAELLVCAVAASARGTLQTTELVLYWAQK
jgi:hypothetical protein